VIPRVENYLTTDCVSVHYDVHICIRTSGHVITTSGVSVIPVKFTLTRIREVVSVRELWWGGGVILLNLLHSGSLVLLRELWWGGAYRVGRWCHST